MSITLSTWKCWIVWFSWRPCTTAILESKGPETPTVRAIYFKDLASINVWAEDLVRKIALSFRLE